MPSVSNSLRPDWANLNQEELRSTLSGLNSLQELASFWEIAPSQLSYYAFHLDKQNAYTTFRIRRRNGRQRVIEAPTPTLKYLQRLIHESLSGVYGPHRAVHGFVPGRSVVTNARNHLGRQYVLKVDLVDFFPSITKRRIWGRH